jgi:Porin subfamily/DcaP outer membrane protein
MTRKRTLGSAAAIGGIGAAIAFLAGPPASRADELADLRASQEQLRNNQDLIQKRIDQLSQAAPGSVPIPGQYVPGYGPPSGPSGPGQPVVSGSFPRSFLIPGTDTSVRVGGFANVVAQWYMTGANQGGSLDGQGGINNNTFFDGPGGTGNLPNIPLNNTPSHSRGEAFDLSPRTSRFLIDARTPTAWGEIKAYLEWDFAYNNTNTIQSNNQGTTMNEFARLRKAFGTFGGFEGGLDTGILHDPDADPELIDGDASTNGRLRTTLLKYTYAGPYGTVYNIGLEQPDATISTIFGKNDIDTNTVPNTGICSATGNGITSALPVYTACASSFAFFDPLQATMPEWVATARVNQPWGHLTIGGVLREQTLNDGQYLFQQFLGAAGTISGDVHPFSGNPGNLGKDDVGFEFVAGPNAGNQVENGGGVASNFGQTLFVPGVGLVNPVAATAGTACSGGAVATSAGCPAGTTSATTAWNARDTSQSLGSSAFINGVNVRSAYDHLVRTSNIGNYGAFIWYQHWWNDELRSTFETSGFWSAVPTSLVPSSQVTSLNKLLGMAHANLFWSPVAFVDFGLEYAYGHRVTTANFKGDSNTLLGEFRVRF